MRRVLFSLGIVVMAAVLTAGPAVAQQASPGPPVTQTGSTGLAAQVCLTAAGAAQQTLTIPGSAAPNSAYIDYLMMALEATGTVTAVSPVPFTTTNIAGTPSFTAQQNALTIGQVAYGGGAGGINFSPPLKVANGGTATTIVGPATITNASQRITACWHVAQ